VNQEPPEYEKGMQMASKFINHKLSLTSWTRQFCYEC